MRRVNEMKKAVVIGANSYIARNLIFLMKKELPECELALYDMTPTHVDGEKNYHYLDILEPGSVGQIDLCCDAIFMFVGITGSANGFDNYRTFIEVNEMSLLNLLNACRRQGSKAKIIFPSTRLVYKGKKGRQSEDAEKAYNTIYAINKFACEQYLEAFNRAFGVRYCIFRICLPYGSMGPGASSYGTADFMVAKAREGNNILLYGEGDMRRTLTYIGDLCHALISGAQSERCENGVFNIGGEDYSLKEMAGLIAARYGVEVEHVPWPDIAYKIESGDTVFDDEKFQSVCPCEYRHTFAEWCAAIEIKK